MRKSYFTTCLVIGGTLLSYAFGYGCASKDCKAYLAVKYSLETLIPSQNTKLAMSVPDAIINIHATELEGPRELMVAAPEGVELLVLVLVLVLLAATVAGRLESAGSCV